MLNGKQPTYLASGFSRLVILAWLQFPEGESYVSSEFVFRSHSDEVFYAVCCSPLDSGPLLSVLKSPSAMDKEAALLSEALKYQVSLTVTNFNNKCCF